MDAASAYAEYESSRSRYKSAFSFQSIADSLRKKIFSEELTSKLDGLEKRLLLEKNQEEINLLNKQNVLRAKPGKDWSPKKVSHRIVGIGIRDMCFDIPTS